MALSPMCVKKKKSSVESIQRNANYAHITSPSQVQIYSVQNNVQCLCCFSSVFLCTSVDKYPDIVILLSA